MNRLLIAVLSIVLVTGMLASGCSKAAEKAPEPKAPQETPQSGGKDAAKAPQKDREPAKKPGDYFPLTVKSTWQYQGEGNEFASFTREVLFVRGNRGQIMENNGGTVLAVVFEVADSAVTRVFTQPETYDRVNLLDRPSNESVIILKAPLTVGTKWKDPNGEREIVAVNAAVSTPAGKFENCVKVKIAGKESTVYEYFREGVGMVKREFISGETRVTSTLEKYNISAK